MTFKLILLCVNTSILGWKVSIPGASIMHCMLYEVIRFSTLKKKATYNANHVLRAPLLSSFSILKNMHHCFLGFTAANVHIPQRIDTEDNQPLDALPSLKS